MLLSNRCQFTRAAERGLAGGTRCVACWWQIPIWRRQPPLWRPQIGPDGQPLQDPPGAPLGVRTPALGLEVMRTFVRVLQSLGGALPGELGVELSKVQQQVAKAYPGLAPMITQVRSGLRRMA